MLVRVVHGSGRAQTLHRPGNTKVGEVLDPPSLQEHARVFLIPGDLELNCDMRLDEIVDVQHVTFEIRVEGRGGSKRKGVKGTRRALEAQLFAQKQEDVDKGDAEGFTPLHLGARQGHAETCKMLIELNADVHSRSNRGLIPLHLAARAGHAAVVDLLLNSDSDVNAMDHDRRTPLHVAAMDGQSHIVELLCSRGARVDIACLIADEPPSFWPPGASRDALTKMGPSAEMLARQAAPPGHRPVILRMVVPDEVISEEEEAEMIREAEAIIASEAHLSYEDRSPLIHVQSPGAKAHYDKMLCFQSSEKLLNDQLYEGIKELEEKGSWSGIVTAVAENLDGEVRPTMGVDAHISRKVHIRRP